MRYPVGGLSNEQVTEIRRIKARVDTERLPRGADPATHAKLGRGGLADVEWAVQLLQLRHGHELRGLRTTRTLDALNAAHDAGLVSTMDAVSLARGWVMASEVRNALMLVRGRPSDQLPRQGVELAGVARALRRPSTVGADEFLDEYLRTARRARAAAERVFLDPP
jgi:glutamate-ammonia-ligase adenylyltransferase